MANDVRLQEGHPVDENLRPIKVGGKSTALEVAQNGNGARVTGGLEVTGTGKSIVAEPLVTNNIMSSGDITLDAAGGDVNILQADLIIPATKKLYFDGDGDTYISESGADIVQIYVGNDKMLEMTEAGADGNLAHFDTACVGFTRKVAIFSATGVISTGGTDDTDVDFRHSNKYRLAMTGDINMINLIFPAASGNFLLVCTTDGDHDVANWRAYESDESAATVAEVMWAGGSVPAFTSSGVDIVSFYWDANEQEAYGVASLAFATP